MRRSTTGCSERLVKPRRWPTSVNGYPHPACSLRPDFGTVTQLREKTAGAVSSETISPAGGWPSGSARWVQLGARCRDGLRQERPIQTAPPCGRTRRRGRWTAGRLEAAATTASEPTFPVRFWFLMSDNVPQEAITSGKRAVARRRVSKPAKTETCPHALPPRPFRRAR